jgi:hypothetical protein
MGDRFACQAEAQLRACKIAAQHGVEIVPVWNKSNREHLTIGSEPSQAHAAASSAVRSLGWPLPYFIDADHIRLETVNRYLPYANFYTIDVADWIGQPADPSTVREFVNEHVELQGMLSIPCLAEPLQTTTESVEKIAARYLKAVEEAGRIYRHIAAARGPETFVTEVSMDETSAPQTPLELLVILAALNDQHIPLQTIAPKFTGRFNKGVDYVGDLGQFEKEFNDDLAVIAYAIKQYEFPSNLKLSVHSGSDKFSIYGPIRRALRRFDAGLHLKTAGTTWLEEVIGLAEAGGTGLALAKEIYQGSWEHIDELCAPYQSVLDIDRSRLPAPEVVRNWKSEEFVNALRHDQKNPSYNPDLRQLLHVGYKMAARLGPRYLDALRENRATVGRNVTENLYQRHIKPLFVRDDLNEIH